jgi:hypothetical protein
MSIWLAPNGCQKLLLRGYSDLYPESSRIGEAGLAQDGLSHRLDSWMFNKYVLQFLDSQ